MTARVQTVTVNTDQRTCSVTDEPFDFVRLKREEKAEGTGVNLQMTAAYGEPRGWY